MPTSLYCGSCDKNFPYSSTTVKINGPLIKIMCPFCGKISEKNESSFLFDKTTEYDGKYIERAIRMIQLNYAIQKTVGV